MFDIEIINGRQVALVTPHSPGIKMLQTINRALMMKRLSSDTGIRPSFTRNEITTICSAAIATNFERDSNTLIRLGLIEIGYGRDPYNPDDFSYGPRYTFSEFGVDVLKRIRDGEEEIEIYLYGYD